MRQVNKINKQTNKYMIDRGNMKAFQEKAQSNNGMFLNAKDFVPNRKIRPIKWIHNGKVLDIKTFLEGWIEVKGKPNGMPVRFETDEEIPEGQYKWKSSSFQGQAPKPQTPDVAIAMLCYDFKSQSIKLASFTQKTIIQQFLACIEEEVEGETNEMYIEDFSNVNIIIAKSGEKAYTVQFKESPEPEGLQKLLEGFHFSWESFMGCGECFDQDGEISYEDVLEACGSKKKPASKKKNEEDEEIDWETVKSPKGKLLSKMTDEELSKLYSSLVDSGADQESTLFKAVSKGMEGRGLDIPF